MRVIKKQSFSNRGQYPIGGVKKNIRANMILCLNPFLVERLQWVFGPIKEHKGMANILRLRIVTYIMLYYKLRT